MGSVTTGTMFTLKADDVNDNLADQMEIIVDVWPKDIFSGDLVYALFSVKNKTHDVLEIQPLEFFVNSYQAPYVSDSVKTSPPGYPKYSLVHETGSEFRRYFSMQRDGTTVRFVPIREPGVVTLQPGETRLVLTDTLVTKPNKFVTTVTDEGECVSQNTEEEPVVVFCVENFTEEYVPCVRLPWPTLNVNQRPSQNERILIRGLHGYIDFNMGFGRVETASGVFTMKTFLPLLPFSTIGADSKENLPNLSAWKAFEEKLSPGTFRDMIRIARIQIQYLDGEQETALDELREWFAKMEPIQSTVLAASLCLPEGYGEKEPVERELKPGFTHSYMMGYPTVGSWENLLAAYRHEMAMRRAIDEVVRPYNTLPNRKMRDVPEN